MHGVVGLVATLATVVVILRAWEAPRAVVAGLLCAGVLGTALYALEATRQPGVAGNGAGVAADAPRSPPVPQGRWIEAEPVAATAPRRARVADGAIGS